MIMFRSGMWRTRHILTCCFWSLCKALFRLYMGGGGGGWGVFIGPPPPPPPYSMPPPPHTNLWVYNFRLCGALSLLAFNACPLNLLSFLILRRSLRQRQWIFTYWSLSKLEKKNVDGFILKCDTVYFLHLCLRLWSFTSFALSYL